MDAVDVDRAIDELEAGMFEGEVLELTLIHRNGSVYTSTSPKLRITREHVLSLVLGTIGVIMLAYGLIQPLL